MFLSDDMLFRRLSKRKTDIFQRKTSSRLIEPVDLIWIPESLIRSPWRNHQTKTTYRRVADNLRPPSRDGAKQGLLYKINSISILPSSVLIDYQQAIQADRKQLSMQIRIVTFTTFISSATAMRFSCEGWRENVARAQPGKVVIPPCIQ